MRQILNLVFATLAEGRNTVEMAQLNAALAPPEDKEKALAQSNMAAMQQLGGMPGMTPLVPRKA